MKKLIALTAMAGLLAAGCASQENRGGSYDNQTAPSYGTSNSDMSTTPNNSTGTSGKPNQNYNGNNSNTTTPNGNNPSTDQSTPNPNSNTPNNSDTNSNSANP